MPFLLPALVSFVCDVGVIWLSSFTQHYDVTSNSTTGMNSESATTSSTAAGDWIYYTIDVYCGTISAIIRLLILCIPLLYHSYTGTALRHILWYRTIYIGMMILVSFHIIAYSIIEPDSIESIVIIAPSKDHNDSSLSSTKTAATISLHEQYEYRRLWCILLCSSVSLFLHHILVRHVRSTAPTPPMMLRMFKKDGSNRLMKSTNPYFCIGNTNMLQSRVKPTMYFVVRTAAAAAAAAASATSTSSSNTSTNKATSATLAQRGNQRNNTNGAGGLPVTLPLTDDSNDDDESIENRRSIAQEPALMNAMNEFLMDMQIRLQRTKQVWSSRLEDFGHRIQQQQQQQISRESSNGTYTTTTTTSNVATTASSSSSSLSLFRVLLQLFAYEDVLDNHKLDTVFDADDGVGLTFYVPQLLSFLLHGALYTSPALEEWILSKCRKNVYFAHKCYWYLRAWCLEVPAESRPITPSISRRNSASSLTNSNLTNGNIGTILSQQNLSQSMYGDGSLPFLDEPAVLEKKQLLNSNRNNSRNLCLPDGSSSSSGAAHPNDGKQQLSVKLPNGIVVTSPTTATTPFEKDKFLIPEERAMIERLMLRVKECGQTPAFVLEYGTSNLLNGCTESSTDDDIILNYNGIHDLPEKIPNQLVYRGNIQPIGNGSEQASTRPPLDTAIMSSDHIVTQSSSYAEHVPVDPSTGSPSKAHYDALLVKQNSISYYGFRSLRNDTDERGTSALSSENVIRKSETEQFDKTPQFLDALIFLAENLYYIPRESRRETLQQQLRSLECELLPSNSIYLPIGSRNQYHRVWRIVAEESIAISTKERVPCIVALEVIDFSASMKSISSTNYESANGRDRSSDASVGESGSSYSGNNQSIPSSSTTYSSSTNDSDIVSEWRYGNRNPLRYVPFLDKVTTSVKVPFAKMKTQVRDHFNNYRDRGASEELQALSSADALVESQNNQQYRNGYDPISTVLIEDRYNSDRTEVVDTNKEIENGLAKSLNNDSIPALSRMNSAGSIISLGQWSSPTTLPRTVTSSEEKLQDELDEIRFRLDSALTKRKRRNGPLLYGSDHEDEPSERSVNTLSGRPPMGRRPSSSATVTRDTVDQSNTSRPPPVVFRESWVAKQERVRQKSAFGDHPGWKLLAILIKGNDDLRQEQMAAQLIQRMATILACEKVNVWLCPYEIIATTNRGGVIEAIPDTISIDSLKKNDPNYTTLNNFFLSHYGEDTDELAGAKANFVESLAAYSMVCFILQLKDRHNGNILLDKWGHIIHIDFGFFFLSSPGKNAGFESAPFKLTREFVELLEGTNSHLFRTFRELCFKSFIALRRRCMEIILLVEMLKNGNEDLKCFRGRPDTAIQQLRDRFRLDLNDRACKEYVNCLIDDSIENWRTDWYDRYQRYFVGVL